MANLELVTFVVLGYDPPIRFFIDALEFELVEDTPSLTNDGRPKRWVVVRPTGVRRASALPARMTNTKSPLLGISSLGALASSCESQTSTHPNNEWCGPGPVLCHALAPSLTANLRFFSV